MCVALAVGAGCRGAAPAAPAAEGSGETPRAAERAEAVEEAAAALGAGAPMPDVASMAQPCDADDDCRAWSPSDWNADAECCYTFPCSLDFVALNRTNRERLRRWQRANPFDCVAHLRAHGPCAASSPRCGLVREAPDAFCDDGQCALRYPDAWPGIDPDAQTCSTAADCIAWRPADAALPNLCCSGHCGRNYVALRRDTLVEVEAMLAHRRADCPAWREDNDCIDVRCAPHRPPDVTCSAGLCRIPRGL